MKAFSKQGISEFNKEKKKPIKSLKLVNTKIDEVGDENITLQLLDRKKYFNSKLYVSTDDNYLFCCNGKEWQSNFWSITFFVAVNLLRGIQQHAGKKSFNKDLVFKDYFEKKNEAKLLFTLKQGDPVYMPSEGEVELITNTSANRAFLN